MAQIVKVLRSLYRAYVKLKGKYERLLGDYGRAKEGNERLSDRLQEVKMEIALRGTVADFERVKRAFGPDKVDWTMEDAKRRRHKSGSRRKQSGSSAEGQGNGQREGTPWSALLIYTCQQVLLPLQ